MRPVPRVAVEEPLDPCGSEIDIPVGFVARDHHDGIPLLGLASRAEPLEREELSVARIGAHVLRLDEDAELIAEVEERIDVRRGDASVPVAVEELHLPHAVSIADLPGHAPRLPRLARLARTANRRETRRERRDFTMSAISAAIHDHRGAPDRAIRSSERGSAHAPHPTKPIGQRRAYEPPLINRRCLHPMRIRSACGATSERLGP